MARKIRFPLKMTNGTDVRTIEELRTNFDLTAILGYYADGNLVKWLRDRYFEGEADKIETLDKNSKSFQRDLCAVLGVEISSDSEEESGEFDEEGIKRRNEKRRLLRDITDDEQFLRSVDSAAFSQDDLYEIYDAGKKEIYLCQGEFDIPLNVTDVTYIGVDNPTVKLRTGSKADYDNKNIKFVNCGSDVTAEKSTENTADEPDIAEDFEALENLAKQGDTQAQFRLGERYYNGDGVEQDYHKASMWYTKAAEKGNSDAQNMLGVCYYYGRGVLLNYDTAVKWFTKSAEQGSFRAKNNLGNCYYNGTGVELNYDKAFQYYKESAKSDYVLAQYNLGKYYLSITNRLVIKLGGDDPALDDAKMWFSKATDQGHIPAMKKLADLYLDKTLGKSDGEKAAEYLAKVAEQGNIKAMMRLAEMYMAGEVVKRNEIKAVEFFTKAAEKNNVDAQLRLGEIYSGGFGKIAQDKKSAEKWYREAANQGNVKAKSKLEKLTRR